jgi:hypothetical protein
MTRVSGRVVSSSNGSLTFLAKLLAYEPPESGCSSDIPIFVDMQITLDRYADAGVAEALTNDLD